MNKDEKNFVEVWEDHVKVRDLLIAMVLCVSLSLGGYILAPGDAPQPLIFGLTGGVTGFILSSFIIKPKRNVIEVDEEEM